MYPHEDAARSAVVAALAERGSTPTALAREAKLDPGTVVDFLNGDRWPRAGSLGKIEKWLGWAPGTIENTARGLPVTQPNVGGTDQDDVAGVLLDVDPTLLVGLTPDERDEAITAAKLSLLSTARAIRRSRETL